LTQMRQIGNIIYLLPVIAGRLRGPALVRTNAS
jgi:hypothetical protein